MENELVEKYTAGSVSGLKGLMVVSKEEGKLLGHVCHIYINPMEKKLSGIMVKDEFWSRERLFIPMDQVVSVGEDVIIINSERECQSISKDEKLPTISIEKLRGNGVITKDGNYLGQFQDANFLMETWALSELYMTDDQFLRVDPTDIIIGADEILVPENYISKIEKRRSKRRGILYRFLREEKLEKQKPSKESENILH